MLIEDYEEAVAEKSTPRRPSWRKPVIAAVIAAAVVAGGVALLVSSNPTRTVSGTPVASAAEQIRYADEVEAQELAAAAEAEESYMRSLETQTLTGIREWFADPANALPLPISVYEVGLIRTGASTFTGTVEMQLEGYSVHQVTVNVTADTRNFMWEIPKGAMSVLLG